MRSSDASEPFDAAAARFLWFVSQMPFQCRPNIGPSIRLQEPEVFNRFRSEDDLETHFGQGIARSKARQTRLAGYVAMRELWCMIRFYL